MFANLEALRTLVISDAKASKSDKDRVLKVLSGDIEEHPSVMDTLSNSAVVSFTDAARILGYKNSRGVYAAVRRGVLQGYYGGERGNRAMGVTSESIRCRLNGGKRCSWRRK